jgi:hypothetical protein
MTEGGNTDIISTTATSEPSEPAPSEPQATISDPMLLDIISQSLHGLDLIKELRGKFKLDPAFHSIIARPDDFRNFEIDDQLVYLKKQGRRMLCIPKVEIQGRNCNSGSSLNASSPRS